MHREILSSREVEQFRRDGYLVPGFRFDDDKLNRLQNLADELLTANAKFGDTPMVCPHVPGGGVQGLRGNEAWMRYSDDPDILDMMEQLMGPNLILWGTDRKSVV